MVRDEHGIARGGIRLPQVEVPVATNSAVPLAPDIFSFLRGSGVPFRPTQPVVLYPDRATYMASFEARGPSAGALRGASSPRCRRLHRRGPPDRCPPAGSGGVAVATCRTRSGQSTPATAGEVERVVAHGPALSA